MPTDVLPSLYARWMAGWLGPIPAETRATCDRCVMAAPPGAPMGPRQFDSVTRCCTYLPKLPNFRAGAVLADTDPTVAEGRATVVARIAAGIAVTPLGLGRPPAWDLVYRHAVMYSDTAFGRTRSLRCPHHLDDGRCGLWRHREGVCATWFCRHERGTVGHRFWDALGELLAAVEQALARACVRALGVGDLLATPEDTLPDGPALDGRPDAVALRRMWGDWYGREQAFYEACAARVDALGWEDVRRVGGEEVETLTAAVKARWAEMTYGVTPERLTVERLMGVELGRDAAQVYTQSAYDPLEVPLPVLVELARFDGRPTTEVRAELEARGVDLGATLLQRLVDWGVLT